jgi:type II secretory pathway pseudopilin PulG
MKRYGSQPRPASAVGGFTLTELIIVIGILVMLMAMVLVALNVGDVTSTKTESELRTLSFAIRGYAEKNGGVLPPSDFSIIDTKVTVNPQPSTPEEKSSATLFYFLTHGFKSPDVGDSTDLKKPRDPSLVGLPVPVRGPFMYNSNIARDMMKDPTLRDRRLDIVDLANGYSGETTWFVDSWGNPYRYSRRAMDENGNTGDEVKMKEEGKTVVKITGFVLESAGPDGKFGDENDPADPARKDNIKIEEGR